MKVGISSLGGCADPGLFGVAGFSCITMGFSSHQWGACDPRLCRTGVVWEQTVLEEGCECLWHWVRAQCCRCCWAGSDRWGTSRSCGAMLRWKAEEGPAANTVFLAPFYSHTPESLGKANIAAAKEVLGGGLGYFFSRLLLLRSWSELLSWRVFLCSCCSSLACRCL